MEYSVKEKSALISVHYEGSQFDPFKAENELAQDYFFRNVEEDDALQPAA